MFDCWGFVFGPHFGRAVWTHRSGSIGRHETFKQTRKGRDRRAVRLFVMAQKAGAR